MSADAAAAPVVRWDPQRHQLVTPSGEEVTRAQDAKARRYLDKGCVKRVSESTEVATWGLPWKAVEVYELQPIPGCHQKRLVKVTTWHDGVGGITAADYECDCQRAAGTVATQPTVCSHALAVHRFRKEDQHV